MPNSASGTHVYEAGTVTYTLINGASDTKLYNATNAGGTAPELLVSKANGAFIISDVPTGAASVVSLTFNANYDYCSVTPSNGVSVRESSFAGKVKTIVFTVTSGTNSFDLEIKNTEESNNVRVDNFKLIAGEPEVPTLSSISVSGQTTTFTVGGTFAFDGTVTATYSNGSTADVTASASVSTPDLSTEGEKTVTITYSEGAITKTTSYVITVSGGVTETISGTFNNSNSALSLTTSSGITITQQQGSGNNAPSSSYNTATTLRIYVGNTITFSGKTITKIEFTHTSTYSGSDGISANVGTYTRGTASSIWTGRASSVTITNTGGTTTSQLRPTSIIVTYE